MMIGMDDTLPLFETVTVVTITLQGKGAAH